MMHTRLFYFFIVVACCCGNIRAGENSGEISDITWKLGPNLPEFRKGGAATSLDGKVISVFGMRQPWGEMATTYVFDPTTQWWQRADDGPIGQTYVQGTEIGNSFCTIGGRSAPKGGVHPHCYRLQVRQGRHVWNQIADLNEKRGWAPSVSVGSRLFVFGGAQGGHGPTLSSVEMLDTADTNAKWQHISDIPGDTRGWLGAAAVGEKIFVIGGSHFFAPKPTQGDDRKRLNELWQFDSTTHKWERKSDLPYRLAGFDCCVFKNRYIIVVGGAASYEDFTAEMHKQRQQDRFYKSYYSPFVIVYDVKTDRWQRMPSLMPVAANDVRVVLLNDILYSIGGENVEPATSNTTPWLRIGKIELCR